MGTVQDDILGILRLTGEPMTTTEIARALGRESGHIARSCRGLRKCGLIDADRPYSPTSREPYTWRLTE